MILNHSIWMSDDQVMAETKTWVEKKWTASPLKPNIFSIQIFPILGTTTKPTRILHKQRGIPYLQTSIHKKKIHTNKSIQISYKFHTIIHRKPYKSIPLISSPSFFLLLFSFSSSSSPSFLFSLILPVGALLHIPKMRYFDSKIRSCLAFYIFAFFSIFFSFKSFIFHLIAIFTYLIFHFSIYSS